MSAAGTTSGRSNSASFWFIVFLALIAAQAISLHLMGRVPICTCGYVKLFEPGVNTPGNSQHISDWYTPSHIIHGFLFYLAGYLIFRRRSFGVRLTFAAIIEIAWELLENSPIIIDRYRSATIANGYEGDSILNSVMDTVAMAIGFCFASRAPIWLTVLIAIGFELLTGWIIRDNLTLNVLMLVWPVDAIREWQAAL